MALPPETTDSPRPSCRFGRIIATGFIYGIPGNQGRGFKVADDTRGPEFDPTSGERTVSAEGLKVIRDYIAFRFPALKDAPLLESRVCQYENTPGQ